MSTAKQQLGVEITESRGGDVLNVTDIDLASVLRYFGFTLIGVDKSATKRRHGRHLTSYKFQAAHPESAHNVQDIFLKFTNDDLKCSPRKLLAESRNLRNLAHHRDFGGDE